MTKLEWEKMHSYRRSEHTCAHCKHCEVISVDPWTLRSDKLVCKQKEQAAAGKQTNASYDCDLWEHQ
jgi:hypothetical protein